MEIIISYLELRGRGACDLTDCILNDFDTRPHKNVKTILPGLVKGLIKVHKTLYTS